jgi:hypothetical protein
MAPRFHILRLLAALSCLSVVAPAAGADDATWVLPPGHEETALGLVAPYRTEAPVEPGTWFTRISLHATGMDFVVEGRTPPAGPVTIMVRWSETTPAADQPPALTLRIEGLDDETPPNLRRAAELLHARIDDRLQSLLGAALHPESPGALQAVPFLTPIRDEVTENREIGPTSWADALRTRPPPPRPWSALLLFAAATFCVVLGIRRRRRGGTGWLLVPGLLIPSGALAIWWFRGGIGAAEGTLPWSSEELRHVVPSHREFAAAWLFLGLAVTATLVALARGLAARRKDRSGSHPDGEILLGLALGSVLVRFGVGGVNLLTDGGSGFERLLTYGQGYGGTSLLVSWILPAAQDGRIWPAIHVTAGLAALAPPALYALAAELEFPRPAAAAAALALLCWPLHAALFTSDFLQGPTLTVGTFGLWLVVRAARRGSASHLLAGAAVFGGLVWMRPEGFLWALPFAAAAAPFAQRRWRDGLFWGAVGLGALAIGCRALSIAQVLVPGPEGYRLPGLGLLTVERFLLVGHPALPWWLWLGVPPGLAVLRHRRRAAGIVVAGLGAAGLALLLGGSAPDFLEFFRYSAPAMLWLSMLAGAGLAALAGALPSRRWRRGASALLLLGFLATPLLHADYLSTAYAPRVSDGFFRTLLRDLPAGASIIVPGELRDDGLDPSTRYRYIAWEEFDSRGEGIPGSRVVSAAVLQEFLRMEGRLPGYEDLDMAFGGRRSGPTEWYYFRSCECVSGPEIEPSPVGDPGTCRGLEEALELAPARTWAAPYRNHRLVAQSRERRPPRYDDGHVYILYKVLGRRGTVASPRAPATIERRLNPAGGKK